MTASTKRSAYQNPPIEEALVEFRFASDQEWDLTIPGKLHEQPDIKAAYAGKVRHQKTLQATIQQQLGQPAGIATHEGFGRVQLRDETDQRLVSVGPHVLSVNVLRPYPGWPEFRERVRIALLAYCKVAKADYVTRIGVRYINKILVQSSEIALDDYFICGPKVPDGIPGNLRGFTQRVEHVYDDDTRLFLTFASLPVKAPASGFLIDLDLVAEGRYAMEDALARVEDLHERVAIAFEAVITDSTREMFDVP